MVQISTLIFSLVFALVACKKSSDSSSSGSCGSYDASTSLIKGPAVGSDGNNSDNPFRALAIHPTDPQVLYVGSEGNGLFRSADGGANWTWLRTGLLHCAAYPEIYSISIDSSNPNRMLLAANSGPGSPTGAHSSTAGVYYSTDAGTSWTQFNSGLSNSDVNSVLIIPGSHYLIGLGAGQSTNGDGIFYNGGILIAGFSASTWSAANTPSSSATSVYWQMISRTSGLLAFGGNPITGSGVASGVIKSTDGGSTWTTVANPLGGLPGAHIEATQDLQTIFVNKRSGEGSPTFYKSVDGGANWTNPISADGPIRLIGSSGTIGVAGGGTGIVYTNNAFGSVTNVLTSAGQVMAIEVAPSNSNYVYATTKGLNVYRSTDGGQTFTLRSNIRTFIDSQ